MRPTLAALVLALSAPIAGQEPPPSAAAYEDLAVELLREYLQIDTTVPPGNELRAAQFYRRVLEGEGIHVEVDEFEPGRANLLATLRGSGAKRPLILMNHMDVVPADPARWSLPPFSGRLQDGLVYGRGAQDMKAEGILQLLALCASSARACRSSGTCCSSPPPTRRRTSRARCGRCPARAGGSA